MSASRTRSDNAGSMAFGLLMMTFGILMMADRLDLMDLRPWWKFWPLGLVYLGLASWLSPGRRSVTDGLGLVAAGSLLLAHNLDVMRLHQSWPLFLVAVGASIVAQAWREDRPAPAAPVEEARHDR
ncbi:MAG: DUF5668 domain-containing protein [Vicinamibacteria bacterium]|nr:DUF5668 domain-containing protein [Vicinamibacteria bacterium]